MNNTSEVIQLFLNLQKSTAGNLDWNDLNPMQQMQFTDCVRFILSITAARKGE